MRLIELGWPESEIPLVWAEWRLKHGEDTEDTRRPDYIASTLAYGRQQARLPAIQVPFDADALVAAVKDKRDPVLVYDAVPQLATLGATGLAKLKTQLRDILGAKLNFNDLNAALREHAPKTSQPVGPASQTVKALLPDAPVAGDAVVPLGYKVSPAGIARRTEDGSTPIALMPLVLAGRLKDVRDGTEFVRVVWLRDGIWHYRTVPRSTLAAARDIVQLADYGAPVNSGNAAEMVAYVAAYESSNPGIPKQGVSHAMGWQGKDGKDGFLWGRRLLRAEEDEDTEINTKGATDAWQGEFQVAFHGEDSGDDQVADACYSRGTYEGWLEAARLIARYDRPAFVLLAGFVPPLLRFILRCPNFIISVSGPSTRGKTPQIRVVSSVWGQPVETESPAYTGTWDASKVSIERASAILSGLPMVLDEAQRQKNPEFIIQAIYDICSGKSKGRGSVKGLRASDSWNTVGFSTGEAPLTSHAEKAGTHARVVELWGEPFGGSSDELRALTTAINSAISDNFGHAGPIFVRHLLRHRDQWEAWRQRFVQLRECYAGLGTTNPILGRQAQYFAAVHVTGEIVNDALGLGWPIDEIVLNVWQSFQPEAQDADRVRAAMRVLYSFASSRATHFDGRLQVDRDGYPKIPSSGIAGRWDAGPNTELCVFPTLVREVLEKAGFKPAEPFLRQMADRNWIRASADGDLSRAVRVDQGGEKASRKLIVFTPEALIAVQGTEAADA